MRSGTYEHRPASSPPPPQRPSDLVGNALHARTLEVFLRQWDAVHLHGRPPAPVSGTAKHLDLTKKAVLLSGSPGVGKTSAARLVAEACGFRVVEVNASDTRNQSDKSAQKGINSKLSNIVKELATNRGEGRGGGADKRC